MTKRRSSPPWSCKRARRRLRRFSGGSPEHLRDYTILKGVNSYAALGRYYLATETTVPEELYEYMDLGALGCRYEDEHPGVFIGSDYVCYPAEEQDLTMEMQ